MAAVVCGDRLLQRPLRGVGGEGSALAGGFYAEGIPGAGEIQGHMDRVQEYDFLHGGRDSDQYDNDSSLRLSSFQKGLDASELLYEDVFDHHVF